MVDVMIKGTGHKNATSATYRPTFEIATVKAGITLKTGGGILLTISDQQLSKELDEFFKARKIRSTVVDQQSHNN